MTAPADSPEQRALAHAAELVDLGVSASQAYGRPDLATRLGKLRGSLADPSVHVVVAGEFKQGKSSLVNGLVGSTVCPVDDDVATALPTYLRHGETARAQLIYEGDPPRREPIELNDVRGWVVEQANPAPLLPSGQRVAGVEIELPRQLLQSGLVLVDTPGVGGLGSAHAAASLAAISMADAVLFVTDASQELTRSEVDFLRQARDLCRTVLCVMTKIDFYPSWRKIRELNMSHLEKAAPGTSLLVVSSTLRQLAVRSNDRGVNVESGFPDLVQFVSARIGAGATARMAGEAAKDVAGACDQMVASFEAERIALADPAAAQRLMDDLNVTKARVEVLRSASAKWSQTLNDGVADLNADIDHDLRARIRTVLQEADDTLDGADPADTWPQMQIWLESRVSYEVLANYGLLRARADALSEDVAEHFSQASGEVLNRISVYNPTPQLSGAKIDYKVELDRMKTGKKAMVMLRSAYGGTIMFTMMAAMAGIALGPIALGIGLVMGRSGLREEKKRQLLTRRSQAKNAVRRYCDEVNFVMGKDSRDTLRRIQRELRDHYAGLAEELGRSNQEALNAAVEAVKRTQSERETRLRDVVAELGRLQQLRGRAAQLATATGVAA